MNIRILSVISLFFTVLSLYAQQDTLMALRTDTVELTALKINSSQFSAPYSIEKTGAHQSVSQNLSFQEKVDDIPGLFTMNSSNYAQDLRISIRGFGARSAFGIRGIKLVVDGIPETTPDGQGQIDNLNLNGIGNIEVIKGPASVLYGNASGGVISINSDEIKGSGIGLGMTTASFGMIQYNLDASLKSNKTAIIINGNRTKQDGYRTYSAFESSNINTQITQQIDEKSSIKFSFNYTNSPEALDAGGVTSEQVESDRTQARDRNISFNAGEAIKHYKTAISYKNELNKKSTLQSYAFLSGRSFDGRLPFEFGGIIDLDRVYWGHGSNYSVKHVGKSGINTLLAGYEIAVQRDDRQRFRNLEGSGMVGDQTLNQKESFTGVGFYILNNYEKEKFLISAGLRYDQYKLGVEDLFLTNGDGSDDIDLSSLNPSLGISYSLSETIRLFSGFRTSFETPLLSELSADPNGTGGFNQDLKPQSARNFEIGIKGKPNSKTGFDAVFYYINTENDLVPYELEDFPGRTFYQNSGSTERQGFEISSYYMLTPDLSLRGHLNITSLTYETFEVVGTDLSGNDLPGIPKRYGGLSLSQNKTFGLNYNIKYLLRGALFTDDSNTVMDVGYEVLSVKLAYIFKVNDYTVHFFGGVNNVFDTKYNDNIRINAFGSRYFEPAPGRSYYLGVKLRVGE